MTFLEVSPDAEIDGGLFRMGHEINEGVDVTRDGEVKAPPAIHARLPDVTGFIVLLGSEGGVTKIADQESHAALKGPLDRPWRLRIALAEALGVVESHYEVVDCLRVVDDFPLRRERRRAATESNGP